MILPFIMLTIYPVDKAHISTSDNNDYLDLANFSSFTSCVPPNCILSLSHTKLKDVVDWDALYFPFVHTVSFS